MHNKYKSQCMLKMGGLCLFDQIILRVSRVDFHLLGFLHNLIFKLKQRLRQPIIAITVAITTAITTAAICRTWHGVVRVGHGRVVGRVDGARLHLTRTRRALVEFCRATSCRWWWCGRLGHSSHRSWQSSCWTCSRWAIAVCQRRLRQWFTCRCCRIVAPTFFFVCCRRVKNYFDIFWFKKFKFYLHSRNLVGSS